MHVPFSDVNFAVFSNCPMFKSLIIPRWLSVFWNIQYGEHFVTKLKIHTPLCFCSAVGQYTHSLTPHSLRLCIVSVHIDLVYATTHSILTNFAHDRITYVHKTISGTLQRKIRKPWTIKAGQRSTKNILYFLHSLQQQMSQHWLSQRRIINPSTSRTLLRKFFN
jgi:hypothetical protein